METITQKTILVEFEGKKYHVPENANIQFLLELLEIPNNSVVRLHIVPDGFLLTRR